MGRLIRFVILLALLITALGFALLNAGTVQVDYYFGKVSTPLSLALVIALAIGAIIGMLASVGLIVRTKRENAKLRKSARNSAREVSHLRSLPVKTEP